MKLYPILSKTATTIFSIASAGLALDAIRNLYNGITTGNEGYYAASALEGIASVWSGAIACINIKDLKIYKRISSLEKKLEKKAEEICKETNASFQRLFGKLDNLRPVHISSRHIDEIIRTDINYFGRKEKEYSPFVIINDYNTKIKKIQ